MAKKKPADSFSIKDSMIYERSDRKRADEAEALPKKPKKHGKIILTVFIIAVILFVGVPWIIVTVVDSPAESIANDGKPDRTYEQILADTVATDKSTELYNMKNPNITDHTAVEALIRHLQIESELGGYTVEIQSDTKPYTVTLSFELSHDVPEDGHDMWEQKMIKYSCAIMSLIDNIAQVNWTFPVSGGTDGAFFNRADAEKLYNLGVTPATFAKSPQSVQLMLNQLGIDLY